MCVRAHVHGSSRGAGELPQVRAPPAAFLKGVLLIMVCNCGDRAPNRRRVELEEQAQRCIPLQAPSTLDAPERCVSHLLTRQKEDHADARMGICAPSRHHRTPGVRRPARGTAGIRARCSPGVDAPVQTVALAAAVDSSWTSPRQSSSPPTHAAMAGATLAAQRSGRPADARGARMLVERRRSRLPHAGADVSSVVCAAKPRRPRCRATD